MSFNLINIYYFLFNLLFISVFCTANNDKSSRIEKSNDSKNVIDCSDEMNDNELKDATESCSTENEYNIRENSDNKVNTDTQLPSDPLFSEKTNRKTIATSKTRGRLGNHLWAYLHLMFYEFTYDIDIVVENEVKSSLTKFFKNFENLKTVDDVCGYDEFFSQYRDMIDSLIVRQYEEMSGVKVELVREGQIAKLYPPEVALKYGKINAESLADSKEFIDEFKVDYSKFPSGCPYKVHVANMYKS